MIIGYVTVKNGAVLTHRDSFILSSVSVVSVRRPYFAGALLLCVCTLGFIVTFHDLLYLDELKVAGAISLGLLLSGYQVAQLTLLSRDLKGTELSSAVWGTAGDLQRTRQIIVAERQRGLSDQQAEQNHGRA